MSREASRLALTAASVLLTAWSLPVHAAIFYAGSTGCSDSGPGSASQPFCTLARAVEELEAGDTLNLLDGTFPGPVRVSSSGEPGRPVVIQAAPQATPVIEGQGVELHDTGLVSLIGVQHVALRGLTIRNSAYWCLLISDGQSVVVDKVVIDGCDHGGLVARNTSELQITGTEINRTNLCDGLCVHEALTLSNVRDFVVSGCWVHDGTKEGIDAKDGSRSGKIFGNVVQRMAAVAIYLNHATGVEVHDNDINHNEQVGIQLTTGDGATGDPQASQNSIYRNVIWRNNWDGIHFWTQAPGEMRENRIYNNTFHGNGRQAILIGDDAETVRDNVIRNNIFMDHPLGGITGSAAGASIVSNNLFHQSGETVGEDAVNGDPLFADAAAGDFHLRPGSPAIDRGYQMGLPTVGAPDIGAFEYGLEEGADPGCGCAAAAAPAKLASGWPLLLASLVWILRRLSVL